MFSHYREFIGYVNEPKDKTAKSMSKRDFVDVT